MNGWIIVQTFINPPDAYMAKAYLEAQGIEVMLRDELSAQTSYSNAIGGVKLLIKDEYSQQALQLLEEGGYIVYLDKENEQEWVWVDKKAGKHCPFCHSEDISKCKKLTVASVILFLILGVFFPLFRSTWQCHDCGKAWKYK